ncbi:hypothetical protein DFH09DRAFT_1078743 [Mycena vulgaris]|nr:hypothetical protein DFH09DRAFT_1078743 [Mycena vulgaris]
MTLGNDSSAPVVPELGTMYLVNPHMCGLLPVDQQLGYRELSVIIIKMCVCGEDPGVVGCMEREVQSSHAYFERFFLLWLLKLEFRISLDSSPRDLLQQLDHLTNWPPITKYPTTFPDDYPPEFPLLLNGQLMLKVYKTSENGILKWFGDALIEAAVYSALYPSIPHCTMPIKMVRHAEVNLVHATYTWSDRPTHNCKQALFEPSGPPVWIAATRARPGQKHNPRDASRVPLVQGSGGSTGSEFRIHTGIPKTLNWLRRLFDPWINILCSKHESSSSVAAEDCAYYQHRIRSFGGVPVVPLCLNLKLDSASLFHGDPLVRSAVLSGDMF